ncbi:zinc finger CCCH domain-containing protein 65 isoform X6 [Lolium perenne]|uniref:zinc finger CCCH domain-containing protein 65 isoform X6 n=1 Tax=Lolium perenne TaxID=4522 RepID=UPI0021F5F9F7|nr:zinc finger CCCH domain-containing protein 65-like isoform X6 [Lolium perenne]
MAYADEKPSLKSDHDVDPIASISRSCQSFGAGDAERIESQFAVFTVADELPKPSGWDDGPVLGFSGGDEITGDKVPVPARPDSRPRFPRRPQEPDCAYYLKFGTCRFGMKCKFNHPARKKKNRVKSSGSSGSGSNSSINKASSPDGDQTPREEYEDLVPDISAQVDTLGFVDKENTSYLGNLKKTSYEVAKENRKETASEGSAREECKGAKECPYYMRTGSCKFATNCRFHHPDPTNVASTDSMLEHENGDIPQKNIQGSSQLNVSIWHADQRALNEHHAPFLAPAPSYSMGMIPPQGMYPSPEWSGYHQVPLGPYYPPGISFHPFPAPPVNHPMYRGADVLGHQQVPSDEYPERPGQPECQHFVKSGFCKFRGKCKYHHPSLLVPPQPAGALSPLGLPLKPDHPVCTYYERYGVCKFGPACMYNHPFNFGHPLPAVAPPLSAQYLTSGNNTV